VKRTTPSGQSPVAAPPLSALPVPDFNLALTLNCGQVFHWVPRGAGWLGMIGDRPCYVEQRGPELLVTPGMEEAAARAFALDHPLTDIVATFPRDASMDAARAACAGLRVIRQPAWECVATFITSAQKAVPHIAQISHTLRQRYGRAVPFGSETLYAYPEPAALAALEESALRACALGYRAKNLLRTARLVAEGTVDLNAVTALDDDAAREELCRLAGVGVKVANCALLFAYERLSLVPIDVWIARILREWYGKKRAKPDQLRAFAAKYFGPYAGYAQQYLFHHARTLKRTFGKKSVRK
jgi:N-glycosylase/DNA lyase